MEIQQTPRQQRIPPQELRPFISTDPPLHLCTPPQTSLVPVTGEEAFQEMQGSADDSRAVYGSFGGTR